MATFAQKCYVQNQEISWNHQPSPEERNKYLQISHHRPKSSNIHHCLGNDFWIEESTNNFEFCFCSVLSTPPAAFSRSEMSEIWVFTPGNWCAPHPPHVCKDPSTWNTHWSKFCSVDRCQTSNVLCVMMLLAGESRILLAAVNCFACLMQSCNLYSSLRIYVHHQLHDANMYPVEMEAHSFQS